MNSTHKVEVVPIRLERHPNADTLSIAHIFSGYQCIVRTADWQDVQLAAYLPPDSVIDSARPEFLFLAGHERIKVKKLRGIVSMGLLMPVPEGSKEGDNVADFYGVKHYEPPMLLSTGGETEKGPEGYYPTYDIDSLRRYAHAFEEGEIIVATEKIHGANGRWVWQDGRMYCGSRTQWLRDSERNIWWMALRQTPELEYFCRSHPNVAVYGEVYGKVQSLRYGLDNGVNVAIFDLFRGMEWINVLEARKLSPQLPWVPSISFAPFPFYLREVLGFAEGPSLIPGADNIREGIVIAPIHERTHPEIGRVKLKVVGNGYLEGA